MVQELIEDTFSTSPINKTTTYNPAPSIQVLDKLADIQAANDFLHYAITYGEDFALNTKQQSGFGYMLQKINEDLEGVKNDLTN